MTTRPHCSCLTVVRSAFALAVVAPLAMPACSSDSSGLRAGDGGTASLDGSRTNTVDTLGGAGGTLGALDAGTQGSDSGSKPGTGGFGVGGAGGAITGGALGHDAAPAPIDSHVAGSGGSVGLDAAGLGGRTGGAGGTALVDAGAGAADVAIDGTTSDAVSPLPTDAAPPHGDLAADVASGRTDARTLDESPGCGDLNEPCCTQRTCNTSTLVCSSTGGGQGTCTACGGVGEACCDGDVCTAPGATCSGGGRGGGTCR
jgi:hypothetical protein